MYLFSYLYIYWASLVVQLVKSPLANAGDVSSILGQEDHMEKKMATLSSILAWEILWIEEPGGPQPWA